MDFKFSEEQEMIRQMVKEFVDREIKPLAIEIDETKKIPQHLIETAKGLGLFGIKFPEKYGGAGGGEISYNIMCEELSRGCGSFPALIGAHESIGATSIYLAGSE